MYLHCEIMPHYVALCVTGSIDCSDFYGNDRYELCKTTTRVYTLAIERDLLFYATDTPG